MGICFIGIFLMVFELIPFLAGAYLTIVPFCLVLFMFGIQCWKNGDPRNARIPIGVGVLFLAVLGALTVMFW